MQNEYQFHIKLRKYRERSGFTQKELAKKLYIDQACISRWENNLESPRVDMLYNLATVLNVPIEKLL